MKLIILYISFSLLSLVSFSFQTNLRSEKSSVEAKVDEKDKNPEKVPIINVHMEEPDRDPVEVKRIEEERRIERNRIREMEMMEEMDKRTFQQIIALQNSQLAKLANIADKTTKLLNTVTTKAAGGNATPSMSFKQKEREKEKDTYTTIFDKTMKNGPLAIEELK